MSRVILGEGEYPNRILFCGERPGFEEARAGRPFVGPAGEELWERLWLTCKLSRDDVYVTNLVKTFSKDPPSPAEVQHWAPYLRAELLKVKPSLIITIGYHAARWFLPQFEDINGDYFHGLPFRYTYEKLVPRHAVVVPVVHSSAALRQPDRYQNQLTTDLQAVRTALAGETVHPHQARVVRPYQVGLAGFGRADQITGFDTEFNTDTGDVQAVTLSAKGREAACIEITENAPPKFLTSSLRDCRALVSHMSKAEFHSCHRMGISLDGVRVDDTMLMAYLLGLPQSLKVLAYRELGYQMQEYEDLVQPLDTILVRKILRGLYEEGQRQKEAAKAEAHAGRRDRKSAAGRQCSDDRQARTGAVRGRAGRAEAEAQEKSRGSTLVPPRALTSIKLVLETDTQDTPRKRWQKSTFSSLATLPPAPSWRDAPEVERRAYAMTDAIAHREARAILWPRIIEQGLRTVYELDRAVLPFLVRNEIVGLACDADRLRELSLQFGQEFKRTCRAINALAGFEVNPLSGEQVSDCLFEQLGVTPTRRTKSGKHFTTEDKYLKARKHEHQIVPRIIEARQINKLIGTYADRLPSLLVEGRYHPDWKYTRTPSGRLAEEVIVLIPKHTDRGKLIRNCFYAVPGNRLVSVDLSQIELRCMAHLSKDPHLLNAYAKGLDIHAQVAHEIFGAPKKKEDQDESKHRLPSKTFNFSIINGTTEFGLLDQLHEQGQMHWDIEQVREALQAWFRVHAGVDRFWDEQKMHARKHGYVKDMFGRRRYIWGVHSTSERIRREAERQCLFGIQSTADGISKVWNKRIWKEVLMPRYRSQGRYCEPWVRVHDCTMLECDKRIAERVHREMLALVPDLLCIPTTAEGSIGRRWAGMKG